MTHTWDPDHRRFADEHQWAVLATGRRDGSPQQSMVAYVIDEQGRLVISAKAYTAKWRNAVRNPKVSVTVPDGRAHLVIYGTTETIDADPDRAQLTAHIFGVLVGEEPDAESIIPMLDEQQRTVLRITPDKTLFQE